MFINVINFELMLKYTTNNIMNNKELRKAQMILKLNRTLNSSISFYILHSENKILLNVK